MLTFQTTNEGRSIQVCANSEGIKKLIGVLEKLLNDEANHIHLYTPPQGHDLDEVDPSGNKSLGEVIITNVGDD